MTFTVTYPNSRSHANNCKMCNTGGGQMKDCGRINIEAADGSVISLMKLSCYRCGYTILFDPEVARNYRYDGSADKEDFPE